jgi:3-hydroxybutyryl-CoA dehydratase
MSLTGQPLHRKRRDVTQEQIWRYGNVSGATDPIHVDPEAMKKSRFGGTIAQGLLVFAWLSELMMQIDAEAWSSRGRIDVSFRAPTRPGDTIEVCCQLKTAEPPDSVYGEYEVWCENQEKTRVINGRAWLPAPVGKSVS